MSYILYECGSNANAPFSIWQQTSLMNFVQTQPGDVISFAGAGGKTTVMMTLASELAQSGIKTLITTTTKMYWTNKAVPSGDINALKAALAKDNLALTGTKLDEKMGRPDDDFLQKAAHLADITLIEADGARRLPFKFPKPSEPVYLKSSNKVVYTVGLSALNRPLADLARSELLADFLQKDASEKLTADDIIKVLASPSGAKKDIGDRRMHIILNQADDTARIQAAKYIITKLKAQDKKTKAAYSCFKRIF